MKRRVFLKSAGLAAVGVSAAGSAPRAAEETRQSRRPTVFLAGNGPLAQAIAAALAGKWNVHIGGPEASAPEALDAALEYAGAVVNLNAPPAGAADAALIDYRTRGTYSLLQAASRRGVRQFVHLSSIDIMNGHDDRYQVTEDWRPAPGGDAEGLSLYLAEFTCREFAREGKLNVAVLRLGNVAASDVAETTARTLEAQSARDGSGLGAWSVFHLVSEAESGRFPIARAKRLLGYAPKGGSESQQ